MFKSEAYKLNNSFIFHYIKIQIFNMILNNIKLILGDSRVACDPNVNPKGLCLVSKFSIT